MNKDIVVVYTSVYNNNTKKIAKAMALKVNCKCIDADCITQEELVTYKYVILGSGIFFTSHHPKIMKIAKEITRNQKVIIISTHGAPGVGKYHNALKSIFDHNLVKVIGEFSVRGYDCTGPFNLYAGGNTGKPNEKDMIKAQKFIGKLLSQYVKNTKSTMNGKHVEIRENECIQCGACIDTCLMGVFLLENNHIVINEDNCVHCNLCIKTCPNQAISIQHSKLELIGIAKKFSKKSSL